MGQGWKKNPGLKKKPNPGGFFNFFTPYFAIKHYFTRKNILHEQHFFMTFVGFKIYNIHQNNSIFGLLRPPNSFFPLLFAFNRLFVHK